MVQGIPLGDGPLAYSSQVKQRSTPWIGRVERQVCFWVTMKWLFWLSVFLSGTSFWLD